MSPNTSPATELEPRPGPQIASNLPGRLGPSIERLQTRRQPNPYLGDTLQQQIGVKPSVRPPVRSKPPGRRTLRLLKTKRRTTDELAPSITYWDAVRGILCGLISEPECVSQSCPGSAGWRRSPLRPARRAATSTAQRSAAPSRLPTDRRPTTPPTTHHQHPGTERQADEGKSARRKRATGLLSRGNADSARRAPQAMVQGMPQVMVQVMC
jgi:hypothetical protein